MTVALSVWIFLRHGGKLITTAGIWSVCAGLFGGFAGIYWHSQDIVSPGMANAAGSIFLSQAVLYYVFWSGRKSASLTAFGGVSEGATKGFKVIGACLLAGGVVLSLINLAETLAGPAAFTGIVLITVSIVMTGVKRVQIFPLLLIAILVAIYVIFVFSGFGRIVLSALAFSILMTLSVKYQTYWLKVGALLSIPPALLLLVRQRESFGLSEYGEALDGIGSIVEPFRQFSVMLSSPSAFELGYGSTFWAAAVTHVPSALWDSKPIGFGLELGWIYNPALASIGGTLAALSHGEWFFNFGWLGLAGMTLVIGLSIRIIDGALMRRSSGGIASKGDFLALSALVLLGGGMTDLFWGGAHTFMGRTGTRLIIVLAVYLLWRLRASTGSSDSRTPQPVSALAAHSPVCSTANAMSAGRDGQFRVRP